MMWSIKIVRPGGPGLLLPFLASLLLSISAFAGDKTLLTYSGKLTLPDGTPQLSKTVHFTFQIHSPDGCVLWQEQSGDVDMSTSGGNFAVQIGAGSNYASGGLNWNQVFQNGVSLGDGSLQGAGCKGKYSGGDKDDRAMYVVVSDGDHDDQTFGPISVTSTGQNASLDGFPVSGAPSDGQVLAFSASTSAWKPITLPNYSVSGVAPIAVNSGSISISAANATTAGALSAADWVAFNSKLSAAAVNGDATISAGGVLALKNVGVAGTYGSSANVPVITTDAQGRVTGVSSAPINTTPSGVAGGDLSGAYPNPSVEKINGVAVNSTGVVGGLMMYDSLSSSWKGKAFPNCPTNQSSYYNSVGDDVECQNISLGWAAVTGAPTSIAGYGITDAIQNAGASTSIQTGLDGNKPSAGALGRFYVSTDAQKISYDNGSAWIPVASNVGSGGTVKNVASANGDIVVASGTSNAVLTLNSGSGANQIVKLNGAAQLPALDGSLLTNLNANQIANLNANQISSGVLPVNRGGTGFGAFNNGDLVVASGATTLASLSDVVAGQALVSGGVGNAPAYSNSIGGVTLSNATVTTSGLTVTGFQNAGFVKNSAGGVVTGGNSLVASDVTGALGYQPVNKAGDSITGSLNVAGSATAASLNVSGTATMAALAGAFDQSAYGYTRIGNLQIAWGTVAGVVHNGVSGSSHFGASGAFSFPAAFKAGTVPTISISADYNSDGTFGCQPFGPSNTSTSAICFSTTTGTTGTLRYTAIGPWQ